MTSVLKVTEACIWKSTLGLTEKGRVGKKNKTKLCRYSIYIFIPSHISFKLKLLTHIVILSYHQEKKTESCFYYFF